MALKTYDIVCVPSFELGSKGYVDDVLRSLIDYVEAPINGSLYSKDLFRL